MSTEIDIINKKLAGEYVTLDGHKLFRLVWSESITENRYGTFREFTEGGLFIREVTETRRVRKYNYIHNRWVFEMWAPGNLVANRETPDAANGDYVPVYVFESGTGLYLPPNEKVVRFLIAALYGRVKKDEMPSQAYLEEREIQRTIESMDDHPNWFQTRPGIARNAVWYAGGVPEWHERRATFTGEVIRETERAAIMARREIAQAEEVARETKFEQAKEEFRQSIAEPEPIIEPETKSPMHRGQK